MVKITFPVVNNFMNKQFIMAHFTDKVHLNLRFTTITSFSKFNIENFFNGYEGKKCVKPKIYGLTSECKSLTSRKSFLATYNLKKKNSCKTPSSFIY